MNSRSLEKQGGVLMLHFPTFHPPLSILPCKYQSCADKGAQNFCFKTQLIFLGLFLYQF